MAFAPKTPPQEGQITAVLNVKNLEIDNKTFQVTDERLGMVQKMDLKIGEVVEYRISKSKDLAEKGKINFVARKTGQTTVTAPPAAAAPPAERPPVRDPVNISGKYLKKAGTTVTIEGPEGPADIPADLDVIKILSAQPPKVNAGDVITLHLIDNNGTWVAKKIAAGTPADGIKTAKDLLQENLEKKKADDAAAVKKKEDEAADAKMKENAQYAESLAKEQPPELPKMCGDCEHLGYCPTHNPKGGCGTEAEKIKPKAPEGGIAGIVAATKANAERLAEASGPVPPAQPPAEPEKPAPEATVPPQQVHPGANVTVNPIQINDSFREAPTQPAVEGPEDCPVGLKVHLDCGSYSNFDMTVPDMPIDRAIARIEADGVKAIALMHRLMAAAKKGF